MPLRAVRLITIVVRSMKEHVSVISSLRIPAQIYRGVILLVPVVVAHDMLFSGVTEKRFRHSTVYPNREVLLPIPELNTQVPQAVKMLFHDSADMRCL